MSVPLHWTADGLPIGVQLVGPPLGDALLFRVASQLEARLGSADPWAGPRGPPRLRETAQKKDVRNGDTASRTPLCGGDLQTPARAASQSRPTLIRSDWPARACSISPALPPLIATDMFR